MKSSHKFSDHLIYRLSLNAILYSFLTIGLGNTFFGLEFPFDFSTLGIYFLVLIQIFSKTISLNKHLLFLLVFIFFHTFVLNFGFIDFVLSFKHFIGLSIFAISIFSFINNYKDQIFKIIGSYYKLTLFVSYLSLFQLVLFLVFHISFLPQNFISGKSVIGSNGFIVEVFDILPRNLGLSTEPAHFSVMLLPSVYLALTQSSNENITTPNKINRIIILLAFLLSFSIVGYFGLFLIIIFYLFDNYKISLTRILLSLTIFILAIFSISQTSLIQKITSFSQSSSDITNTQYTTNDQTTFALLSNLMVAKGALANSYYLGKGLNSHQITYNNSILNIFSSENIPAELNKETAGSLFIRITSEFGIPGLLFIFFIFFVNKLPINNLYGNINQMSLIFLLTYCLRTGHYISNIFIFFLAIYIYSHKIGTKREKIIS